MGIEMSVTEFKAKCLELFEKLYRREIDSVTITKRGRPMGRLLPPDLSRQEALQWHGFMKGESRATDPDFDLTGPIVADQEFEPEIGNLP